MKKKMMLFQMMLLGLLMFALAACGGGEESTGSTDTAAVEEISVVMHDIYYGDTNDNATKPFQWSVTHGAAVKVSADNKGSLEHNWAIIKLGEESKVPNPLNDPAQVDAIKLLDLGNVAAGEKSSKRFTAPEPGEYLVICTVAGHYPAMQGRLTVK